jgi:hypothetical protein
MVLIPVFGFGGYFEVCVGLIFNPKPKLKDMRKFDIW